MRVYVSISEREYLTFQRMRAAGKLRAAGDLQLILADGSTFPEKGRIIIVYSGGGFEDGDAESGGPVPKSKGSPQARPVWTSED